MQQDRSAGLAAFDSGHVLPSIQQYDRQLQNNPFAALTHLRLRRVAVVEHANQAAAVRRHARHRLRLQRLPRLLHATRAQVSGNAERTADDLHNINPSPSAKPRSLRRATAARLRGLLVCVGEDA